MLYTIKSKDIKIYTFVFIKDKNVSKCYNIYIKNNSFFLLIPTFNKCFMRYSSFAHKLNSYLWMETYLMINASWAPN